MIKKFARLVYRFLRTKLLQDIIPLSQSAFPSQYKNQIIEVVGFFESYSGIGESARLCALSLKDSGYQVKCRTVEADFKKTPEFTWTEEGFYQGSLEPAIRIFHLNPPMLPPAIFSIGLGRYKKSFNIGYWAWELEDIPLEWRKALRYVNAVMTPSSFTTGAVKKHTEKPVVTVLHPIGYNLKHINTGVKERLGISAGSFLISTIFSFGSALERKNPQALITCFKNTFTRNENVVLVLKSNSATTEEKARILALIGEDPRIMLIDASWDRADILGLIKESDLYASFHRSEGFGLTIAEAMSLGTPVITTNWSGNLDFCNQNNAFLVDYTMVPVISGSFDFQGSKDQKWAEVSQISAVENMRAAFDLLSTDSPQKSPALVVRKDGYDQAMHEICDLIQPALK